jgi:hypothetical protein
MNQRTRKRILAIYDLILSLGAIYTGVLMINSNSGIFAEYPKEWLTILPFKSWVIPGIIAIAVFGIGNIISAVFSFTKESNKSWAMSIAMGVIFFVFTVAQVIILGEWYMATIQFFILSIIQICLSVYVRFGHRRNQKSLTVGRN